MADFLRRQAANSPEFLQFAAMIGQILHEPARRAVAIARACVEEGDRSRKVWQHLATTDHASALRAASIIEAPGLEQIADFMDRSRRGVVVTTIHGGDYLLGLLKLRHSLRSDKKILIVRKKAASSLETRVFTRFNREGNPVEVIRHGQDHAIRLVRALRRGHIVVALHDLPPSYGPSLDVPFLGQTMAMVRGPAELAVLGQADVVPLLCHQTRGQSRATFLAPLRPGDTASACRQLAHHASTHIAGYPEQWQHWFHVPEMMAAAHA